MSEFISNRATLAKGRTARPFDFRHPMTVRSGYFIPIYCDSEIMPATTFNLNVDCKATALTMTRAPLCDIELVYMAFFVPHDGVVWNYQKQFWGETDNAAWTTTYNTERPVVQINVKPDGNVHRSNASYLTMLRYLPDGYSTQLTGNALEYWRALGIAQYLGYPNMGASTYSTGNIYVEGDALAFRAYAAVWNWFIRDKNVQPVVGFDKGNVSSPGTSDGVLAALARSCCLPFGKHKDMFTGIIPSLQYGADTIVPLLGSADIKIKSGTTTQQAVGASAHSTVQTGTIAISGNVLSVGGTSSVWTPNPYYADLTTASGVSITDFRSLVLMQHYKETLALFGHTMQDTMLAVYGSNVGNERLDQPEGIMAESKVLNIQTVTSTAQADSTKGLGYLGGRSETYIGKDGAITYTAKKFGTLLIACGIRLSKHIYSNRIPRNAIDQDLWSQVNPLFAGSSEVPVYKCEMSAFSNTADGSLGWTTSGNDMVWKRAQLDTAGSNSILGYQEYGFQAKFPVSYASGLMNPLAPQALSDFTAADAYTSTVAYNEGFPVENPNFIGRAFVDQTEFAPQFYLDWHITGTVVTPLPQVKVPGVGRV